MKIKIALLTVALLLAGVPISHTNSTPDEQFYFKINPPGPEYIGYASSNSFELRMSNSSYIQVKFKDSQIHNVCQMIKW